MKKSDKMDFQQMSFPDRFNKFGKLKYKKRYSNESTIDSGSIYMVQMTDTERDEYGPFPKLTIVNNSGLNIEVYINGTYDGNNNVNNYDKFVPLPANSTLYYGPEEGDTIVITMPPLVKNVGGTGIVTGLIHAEFQNY